MESDPESAAPPDRREWRRRAVCAQAVAASALDLPAAAIDAPSRGGARAAFGRQIAMYLAHVSFEMSLAKVADAFGRDRSTVAYACHRIEDLREEAAFDSWLDGLDEILRLMNSAHHDARLSRWGARWTGQ